MQQTFSTTSSAMDSAMDAARQCTNSSVCLRLKSVFSRSIEVTVLQNDLLCA